MRTTQPISDYHQWIVSHWLKNTDVNVSYYKAVSYLLGLGERRNGQLVPRSIGSLLPARHALIVRKKYLFLTRRTRYSCSIPGTH
jgi:hypothetical protein